MRQAFSAGHRAAPAQPPQSRLCSPSSGVAVATREAAASAIAVEATVTSSPLPHRFFPPPPPQRRQSVGSSSSTVDHGGCSREAPPRIPLAYATYSELVASKEDFKRMTDTSFGHTLNCKRIIVEMVKVLIKPVYASNQIDKAVFRYLCESVTKDVTGIIRTSALYDYKQVPFPPSKSVFVRVANAIHKRIS